jgi:CHAT domain-containing protein
MPILRFTQFWAIAVCCSMICCQNDKQPKELDTKHHKTINNKLYELADSIGNADTLIDAQRHYKEGIRLSNEQLTLPQRDKCAALAELYYRMGKQFYDIDNYAEAQTVFDSSSAIRDRNPLVSNDDKAKAFAMLGNCLMLRKQFIRALDKFKKADDLKPSDTLNRKIKTNIADSYDYLGDYQRAIENYKLANYTTYDGWWRNTGLAYSKARNFKTALQFLLKANELYSEDATKDSLETSESYTNLGICYRDLDNIDSSFYYFKKGLQLTQSLKKATSIANNLNELSRNYLKIHNLKQAEQSAKSALSLLSAEEPTKIAEAYSLLCLVAIKQQNWQKAAEYSHKTLAQGALLPNLSSIDTADYPKVNLDSFSRKTELVEYLHQRITPLSNLAKTTQKQGYWTAALNTCLLADTVVQKLRYIMQSDETRFYWNETAIPLYEKGIQIAHKLYQITKETKYLMHALTFFERTKSPVLREALFEKMAKQRVNLPASMLEREKLLMRNINALEKQAKDVSDKPLINSELLKTRQALSYLQDSLKKDPTYKRFFDENYAERPPLSMEQLQAKLSANQLAISYLWGKDSLYSFSWSLNTTPLIQSIILTPELEQNIQHFKQAAQSRDSSFDSYKHLLYPLYKNLLESQIQAAEKTDTIKRIVLITDGNLHNFPFEALTKEPIQNLGSIKTKFLINFYAFSQVLSIDKLAPSVAATSKRTKPSLTGFSISKFDKDDFRKQGLNNLDGAAKELGDVQKQFKNPTILEEQQASKNTFLKEATNAQILYISTHAIADNSDPLNAKIYLYPTHVEDSTDYYITSKEIYNTSNKAELVVLSACQTAQGKIQQGEGALSLARAFMFAGSQTLIASRWNMTDNTGIMPVFFKHWLAQTPNDVALQQAKIAYFENNPSGESSHPYFWASMVIIGNLQNQDNAEPCSWLWLIVLLVFIGIGVVGYRKNVKTKEFA